MHLFDVNACAQRGPMSAAAQPADAESQPAGPPRLVWRWLRRGAHFAIALAVLMAGAYVADRSNMRFDLSSTGHNSVHPISASLLEDFAGPLTLSLMAHPTSPLAEHAQTLARRHQSAKQDFQLELIDPKTELERARHLGLTRNAEALLAFNDKTARVKRLSDQGIANALIQLGRTSSKRIRSLVGHGERSLVGKRNDDLGLLGQALSERGFDVGALDLSVTGDVPSDLALLVLSAGSTAFLPAERNAITNFMDSGGNILVLSEPGQRGRNLDFLTHTLGLLVNDISVIASTDAERRDQKIPENFLMLNHYPKHPLLEAFELVTLFPHIAQVTATEKAGWQHQVLLAAGFQPNRPANADEPNGTGVGFISTRGAQRAGVVGDGDFVSNSYLGNGGNLELSVRLIEWLAEEETLNIPPRLVPDPRLLVSQRELQLIAIAAIAVIPLLLVVVGTGRWLVRQRR